MQNGPEANPEVLPTQSLASVMGEQTLAVDLARVEIDQAIATAHRFPRVLDTVVKKIEMMACYNGDAAENCIYSLPRGGKPIIGPSIGFANVVAQAWGNCSDGARIVYINRSDKVIVAEGGFHDLESNRKTIVPVQRRIMGKDGRIFPDDMIMVTGMAAASIARRNAILNAVPRALWFPIYEKALLIVRGTVETFAEKKDKALKAFAQFGVKPEQVFSVLGLKGEVDLTLEHIAPLRGMYSALRDGSTTVEEMFDPRRQTGGAFEKVENPLGSSEDEEGAAPMPTASAAAPTAPTAPAEKKPRGRPKGSKNAAAETHDPETGEVNPAAETQPVAAAEAPTASVAHEAALAAAEEKPVEAAAPPAATIAPPLPNPRNAAEYRQHMIGWLASSTSASAVEDQWRQERTLRGDCAVVEDAFIELKGLMTKRVAELSGAS